MKQRARRREEEKEGRPKEVRKTRRGEKTARERPVGSAGRKEERESDCGKEREREKDRETLQTLTAQWGTSPQI